MEHQPPKRSDPVIRSALYLNCFDIKSMAEKEVEQYLYDVQYQCGVHHNVRSVPLADDTAVFCGKAHRCQHDQGHTDKIYVISGHGEGMCTGYDDNEVPDYGRNEGQIEQSHRLADFFMGVKTFDSAKKQHCNQQCKNNGKPDSHILLHTTC